MPAKWNLQQHIQYSKKTYKTILFCREADQNIYINKIKDHIHVPNVSYSKLGLSKDFKNVSLRTICYYMQIAKCIYITVNIIKMYMYLKKK